MSAEHDATSRGNASMSPIFPDLAGRVALVTGGSGWIGAETARQLARNGALVAVNGRREDAIAGVVESIRGEGGRAIGVAANCTDAAAIELMRERIERELGVVEIVMAFAGGDGAPEPFLSITEERWRSIVDGNLTSTFLTLKAFLPGMVMSGRGAVVTMASAAARSASLAAAPYAAAKGGIVVLTRQVAREMAPHGIRVNCVSPSAVRNEKIQAHMTDEMMERMVSTFPLGRIGEPEDVAHSALFLASSASGWITGITVDIAGGRIMP